MTTPIYIQRPQQQNPNDAFFQAFMQSMLAQQQNQIQKEALKLRQQELKLSQDAQAAKQQEAQSQQNAQGIAARSMIEQLSQDPASQALVTSALQQQPNLPMPVGIPGMGGRMSEMPAQAGGVRALDGQVAANILPAVQATSGAAQIQKQRSAATAALRRVLSPDEFTRFEAADRLVNEMGLSSDLTKSLLPPDALARIDLQTKAQELRGMQAGDTSDVAATAFLKEQGILPGDMPELVPEATKLVMRLAEMERQMRFDIAEDAARARITSNEGVQKQATDLFNDIVKKLIGSTPPEFDEAGNFRGIGPKVTAQEAVDQAAETLRKRGWMTPELETELKSGGLVVAQEEEARALMGPLVASLVEQGKQKAEIEQEVRARIDATALPDETKRKLKASIVVPAVPSKRRRK